MQALAKPQSPAKCQRRPILWVRFAGGTQATHTCRQHVCPGCRKDPGMECHLAGAWSDRLSSSGHTQVKAMPLCIGLSWLGHFCPVYVALTGCRCDRSHLEIWALFRMQAEMLTQQGSPALRAPRGRPPLCPSSCSTCTERVLAGSQRPGCEFRSYHPRPPTRLCFSICKMTGWDEMNSRGSMIR